MLNPKTIKACPSETLLSFILQLSPDPPLLGSPPPQSVLGSAPLCFSISPPPPPPDPTPPPRPPPTPHHVLSGAPLCHGNPLFLLCSIIHAQTQEHRWSESDYSSVLTSFDSESLLLKTPTIKENDQRRGEKPNYLTRLITRDGTVN